MNMSSQGFSHDTPFLSIVQQINNSLVGISITVNNLALPLTPTIAKLPKCPITRCNIHHTGALSHKYTAHSRPSIIMYIRLLHFFCLFTPGGGNRL